MSDEKCYRCGNISNCMINDKPMCYKCALEDFNPNVYNNSLHCTECGKELSPDDAYFYGDHPFCGAACTLIYLGCNSNE